MNINDNDFNIAMDRLLYMMHNDFKDKVGLAIHIVSEETGFTTKELSHELFIIKKLKNNKYKNSNINNDNYARVYRG